MERWKNPYSNWKRPTLYAQNGLRLENGAGLRREDDTRGDGGKARVSNWDDGWDHNVAWSMESDFTLGLEA